MAVIFCSIWLRPCGAVHYRDRAQEMGFRIGLGLVLMLMVFATYNDILHLAAS